MISRSLKDVYKSDNYQNSDKYVTDGYVLFTKEFLRARSLVDVFYLVRIRRDIFQNGELDRSVNLCIPFERGYFAKKIKGLYIDECGDRLVIFAFMHKCCAFKKDYTKFIEKVVDVDHYTIVEANGRHLLKFWDPNNRFLGCLASVALDMSR